MTRESHNTQKKLGFVNGYIKSPETKLKKEEAQTLYNENKKFFSTQKKGDISQEELQDRRYEEIILK